MALGRAAAAPVATLALLLASLLAACPGHAAEAAFADGQHAYDAGRFEEALRVWGPLAEAGDAEAQFGLGLLSDLGQGAPADPARAHAWYRRAAEAGLARAQFNVAVMLDSGIGVPRDRGEAALWYAKAAARGHPRAQYNLAQLYDVGEGVPRNPAQARGWYRAAAGGGLAAAARKLDAAGGGPRPPATVPTPPAGTPGALSPATLLAPDADALIEPPSGAGALGVELVWTAPEQPAPVRYFVEVVALGVNGPREVFADFADQTAVLLRLEREPARYAWRVYVVGERSARYALGDWREFAVWGPEPAS